MADDMETLAGLIEGQRTAMLTTTAADGGFDSRPMALQDAPFDGDLWMIAAKDSPKVREIEADPHVAVTMMAKDSWVAVDGQAELVDDPDRLEQFWNPFVQAWFPDGPEDPNVTLLRIVGDSAQYWDASGGRITTALKMVRSAVTGHPPTDVGDSATVEL